MNTYCIPEKFYFRLHHPRPRFKGNIENVLIYMASEIVRIGEKSKVEFKKSLNDSIKMFPGNFNSTDKTINNWRTEIDALFAFIQERDTNLAPSYRAKELAEKQDLVKFFKLFCYYFQYPGGFVKPHANLEFFKANINFKPAQYILSMLYKAESKDGTRAGITKAEATHCIFNDLRVTRDNQNVEDTWSVLVENRKQGLSYDWDGDVIRYAGDILDYLVQANLLNKQLNNHYYLNKSEALAIQRFIHPSETEFNFYSRLERDFKRIDLISINKEENKKLKLSAIAALENDWINYFNTPLNDEFFDTDVLSLVTTDDQNDTIDLSVILSEISNYSTGNIGNVGETLTINHEIKRLEFNGRPDLTHLVKFIPTHLAVGYDVSSRETDGSIRNIEVKTTTSTRDVIFTRFHLTPNEWAVADSYQDCYYVYRLMVSKESIKLYIIQNPVKQYKLDKIKALPRDGMDITFDPKTSGFEEELLI